MQQQGLSMEQHQAQAEQQALAVHAASEVTACSGRAAGVVVHAAMELERAAAAASRSLSLAENRKLASRHYLATELAALLEEYPTLEEMPMTPQLDACTSTAEVIDANLTSKRTANDEDTSKSNNSNKQWNHSHEKWQYL